MNENGLAELTRDIRSTDGLFVPEEYRPYTLNFADPVIADDALQRVDYMGNIGNGHFQ